MIKMIIAMIMVSLTALKKPNLLYISLSQSARAFKENPLNYFQFKDLSSNGNKSQIFGPRVDSDSVLQ